MSDTYFNLAIYLLGFIWLVSIGLIPFRSWNALSLERNRANRSKWKISTIPVVTISMVALGADIKVSERIFSCLTKVYCGPNIASGWIYLAVLGGIYLIFEATIALMKIRHE